MKQFTLFLAFACTCMFVFGQDKANVKFGKISPENFSSKNYAIDSNANAVIIADIGNSRIVGNSKGWFSLEFKRYRRVLLVNKKGFDAATTEISVYSEGQNEEKIAGLRAVTYNLENGKVVETKLDKDNVFKDKLSKNWTTRKFTFPNIKEGSIIELEYTITSDYLRNLRSWTFQGEYPTLWSEYNLTLPDFFTYAFLPQGYQKYFIQTRHPSHGDFNIIVANTVQATESYRVSSGITEYRWVIKDAPAVKEESYVSTVDNYLQKIEFELTAQHEPLEPHVYLDSWTQVADDMLKDEDFGLSLSKDNNWLGDVIKPLLTGASGSLEKAKRLFCYVRDNITCTDHSDLWLGQTLKNVLKSRSGTVSEVNMLLTVMLRYAQISADPVILSTRSNGYTYALYPIMSKFNYVICAANIDGKQLLLDAAQPKLGFGKLTPACYNGHARIINESATALNLSSDSLYERKLTSVLLNSDGKGELVGTFETLPGYYESHAIRETIKEKGKDDFFKDIRKAFGQDVDIMEPKIDSLDDLDDCLKIAYHFKMNEAKEDLLYINPMFGEGYKENPFKSAERFYPVEMPYASDETYIFNMFVPDGYEIDEVPKPIIVKLNDRGDGQFEYMVSQSAGTVSLRSRIQLKRANYEPAEYDLLREFFNLVVKKQSEQIVLKKKK